MLDQNSILEFMGKNTNGIIISSVAMAMHTMYDYTKGKKIQFTRTVINLILAGWLGYIMSEVGIPPYFIAIGGWGTIKILDILEEEGAKILANKLLNK